MTGIEHIIFKADISSDEAGTVTGIAWPFDGPDTEDDVIEKGAFNFASDVPMVMEHNERQVVGVWKSFRETDSGLQVTGRLFIDGIEPAREAHRQLRKGIVSGLSIQGIVNSSDPRPSGGRNIRGVTINEISLCRRPVNTGARITIVKSINEEHPMENELEIVTETKTGQVIDAQELKVLKARLDKVEAKSNRPTAVNNNQPGADNDNTVRKAFGDFLRTGWAEAGDSVRKAMTVTSDAPGHVLAPEETSSEFLRNLVEFSPVRSIADVRSTGSHAIMLPKRLTVTNAKWKGEAVVSEASEPTFDQMEISVKEMTTHVDIGNWLIEDATHDVEAEVRLALAEDFAAKEALSFVSGTTAVEPNGFMADAGIATALNGHATNLSADALISLFYSLPATYRNRGTWTMNGTTLAAVRKLKDGAGNYLWQPSYVSGQPETILGRPVVELLNMPDFAAAAFPIMFGDFKSGYRIYDRIELAIRPNPYLLATEGLVRFHARRRVGAGVVRPEAFRKLKMATA